VKQYQDATEIVDVDVIQVVDVQLIQVVVSVETTAAYGSFFSSSSVEDVVTILSAETDAAEMTAASGSFFFSSSAEDVVTIHTATMVVDATIAAANQRNFEDGYGRPFCMHFINSYHIFLTYII